MNLFRCDQAFIGHAVFLGNIPGKRLPLRGRDQYPEGVLSFLCFGDKGDSFSFCVLFVDHRIQIVRAPSCRIARTASAAMKSPSSKDVVEKVSFSSSTLSGVART